MYVYMYVYKYVIIFSKGTFGNMKFVSLYNASTWPFS